MIAGESRWPEAVLLLLMFITLVVGFVVLTLAGVGTAEYVVFLAGPLMTTIVGTVLTFRVRSVAAEVSQVKAQTNGIALAQNEALDAHLTRQDRTAADTASTAALELRRITDLPSGNPPVQPA